MFISSAGSVYCGSRSLSFAGDDLVYLVQCVCRSVTYFFSFSLTLSLSTQLQRYQHGLNVSGEQTVLLSRIV